MIPPLPSRLATATAAALLCATSLGAEPVRLDFRAEFPPEAHPELALRVLLTDITDGQPTLAELQRAAANPGSPEREAWQRRRREIGRMTPSAPATTAEVELPDRYRLQFRVYPRSGDPMDYTVEPAALDEVRPGETIAITVTAVERPPVLRLLHEGLPPGTPPLVRWQFHVDGKAVSSSADSCRLPAGARAVARHVGIAEKWGIQAFEFEPPRGEGHSLRLQWANGALAGVSSETIALDQTYGGSIAVTRCGEPFGFERAQGHPLAGAMVHFTDALAGREVAKAPILILSQGFTGLEEMPTELKWNVHDPAFRPEWKHSGTVNIRVGEVPSIELPFRVLTIEQLTPVYAISSGMFAVDSATKERFPVQRVAKPGSDPGSPDVTLHVIVPCDYRGRLVFGAEGYENAHEIDLGKVTGDTIDFRNAVVTRNR